MWLFWCLRRLVVMVGRDDSLGEGCGGGGDCGQSCGILKYDI